MAESIGETIDKLCTVNNKIYHMINVIQTEKDDKIVANIARKTQALNKERSALINEINEYFGERRERIVKT